MADIISRMRLDSSDYDQKIRRAGQNLLQFEAECRKAGKSLNDISKENLQYVQALGKMETSTRSAKGKVSELSQAFVNLRAQYDRLTESEKKGTYGMALSASMEQLKRRTMEAKAQLASFQDELNGGGKTGGVAGGGLFGSDKISGMVQVLGGNLMTKAVSLVGDLAMNLKQTVAESIDLAKNAEGVTAAFNRLSRPGLLDNLREATHGTIDDLELMKQAVKFDNFNLSLDQMGTLLAFAQQQAKDTGQDIGYLVDSIVTGLGRQSLPILDNLGLSASEIRDRMKETGDMTTAVASIIKDRMDAAGGYVETAADRATKAEAEVKNAMLELGNTMLPLEETASSVWHNIEVGAINLLNNAIKPLIDHLTEAGRLRREIENQQNSQGGRTDNDRYISELKGSGYKGVVYTKRLQEYQREIDVVNKEIARLEKQREEAGIQYKHHADKLIEEQKTIRTAIQSERDEYKRRAKPILIGEYAPQPEPTVTTSTPVATVSPRVGRTTPMKVGKVTPTEKELTEIQILENEMKELLEQRKMLSDPIEIAIHDQDVERLQEKIDELMGKGGSVAVESGATLGQQFMDNLMADLAAAAEETDRNTLKNVLTAMYQEGIDSVKIDVKSIQEQIGEGMNIPDEYWQNLQDQINEELKKRGANFTLKIDPKTGAISKEIAEQGKKTGSSWREAASAIQSVSSAMQQAEDPTYRIMGIIGEAIANIALGFSQATAADSKMGVWGWIASIAAGLSTMVGTISAIKSATAGSYAEGGIIPGHSYHDELTANVSSGELILNRAQQNVIANQLQSNERSGVSSQPYVSGENIYLGVNNYLRKSGRGELVTTRG